MIKSNYTLGNRQFVEQQVELGAIFYVSHSGGKDSQAMYLYLRDVVPSAQLVIVHAHLGDIEWPGTIEHINNTRERRHPFNIVRAIDKRGKPKTLLSEVIRKAAAKPDQVAWPSSAMRWCTSDLKRGPIYKFIRNDLKARGSLRAVNCVPRLFILLNTNDGTLGHA